jgi:hypothetical protein
MQKQESVLAPRRSKDALMVNRRRQAGWRGLNRLAVIGALACVGQVNVAASQDPAAAGSASGQTTAAEQNPGATCIAIVLPSVQGVDGNATAVATAVRDLFASYLTGPSLQPMPVEARLTSQALAEARLKQCPVVLIATVSRKRSGGGNGVLGQMVGQVIGTTAYQIPGGGTVAGTVAQSIVVASAQAVSTLAASTHAKDEIRLEYRLATSDGRTQLGPVTDKAKAATDGEDLLTPLVERAAEAVAARVISK